MSASMMPKEQYEYIKGIQDEMLESTNMTKSEAWSFGFRCWQNGYHKINKELEQYRALGTVEEILKVLNHQLEIIAIQHKTLKEYRNLGTVEELRVARDKQVAKKPIPKYGINNAINSYHCPTCENSYLGGGEYRYECCEDCGQKLDWGNEDD